MKTLRGKFRKEIKRKSHLYGTNIGRYLIACMAVVAGVTLMILGTGMLPAANVLAQSVSSNELDEATTEIDDEILEAENTTIKYSGTDGDLSWTIDTDGHLEISGNGDYEVRSLYSYNTGWLEYKEEIKTATVNVTSITSTALMFYQCSNLTNLDVSGLDTSKVTDMSWMFYECYSLASLNISGFDTSNATDMSRMFLDCKSLTSLDVSRFDTSNATDMSHMFSGCSNLTGLDVSGFDTSNATDMCYMFDGCSSLTSLDVGRFDTSAVTDMHCMFCKCSSLADLNMSGFNTSSVTNMMWMFDGCSSLTSLDVSGFDTSSVTSMSYMFDGCRSLTSLDISAFNLSKVDGMSWMFDNCNNLTELKLPSNIFLGVELPYIIYDEKNHKSFFQDSFSWKDSNGITQQYAIRFLPDPMTYKKVMVPFVLGEKELPTPQPQGTILKSADLTSKTDSIPANASFTVTGSDPKNPTVAFDGVSDVNAKAVKIPATIIYDGVEYKVTTVSPTAFQTQKDQASFEVTDNRVESLTVAYKAPTNKKKAKVTIPQYSTYRGIKFKVTSVSAKSFRNNKKVTQISIATSITKIGDSCFEGCINLKSVTIGKSLKTIGKNAFKNCKKLTKITIKSTKLQSVGKNALKGVNAKCRIKVPGKQVKKYKKLFAKKGQKSSVKVVQ